MPTLSHVLQGAVQRLEAAGSDEPQANAQWLLAHVLGVSRTWVLANGGEPFPADKEALFSRLLARKEAGEPLSHIVGMQPFCGLDIRVTPDVLTPRPETEELVERCAAQFERQGRYTFLDMCTGVLAGDILTVYAPDDITLGRLDNDRVRGILTEAVAQEAGQTVRLMLRVGEPPQAQPVDNLQNLLKFGSQFDNIQIK